MGREILQGNGTLLFLAQKINGKNFPGSMVKTEYKRNDEIALVTEL